MDVVKFNMQLSMSSAESSGPSAESSGPSGSKPKEPYNTLLKALQSVLTQSGMCLTRILWGAKSKIV